MNRFTKAILALAALAGLAACDSKTASSNSFQTASIQWDVITASEGMGTMRNQNLIAMR